MGRKIVAVIVALHVFPIFGIIVMRSVGGLTQIFLSLLGVDDIPAWLRWSGGAALTLFALAAAAAVSWKVYRWASRSEAVAAH
jgi:hypothetical protein